MIPNPEDSAAAPSASFYMQNQVGQAFKTTNSIVLYKPPHSLSENEMKTVLLVGLGRRGRVRRVRRRLGRCPRDGPIRHGLF